MGEQFSGISTDLLVSLSMNYQNSAESHSELVGNLAKNGLIKSEVVEQAMLKVDRCHFSGDTNEPYADKPHDIGHSATISSAHMHALALESLSPALKEGHKVLDVGCGSGYLTVCMSLMVGETGQVAGIDSSRELVETSIANTTKAHASLIRLSHATLHHRVVFAEADGFDGFSDHGPFHAIHVGAAVKSVPPLLIQQLREGGLMLVPVYKGDGQEQDLVLVRKDLEGVVSEESIMTVVYSPMTEVVAEDGGNAESAPAPEPAPVLSVAELTQQLDSLSRQLKAWQAAFKDAHGRNPSLTDMNGELEMAELLQAFKAKTAELKVAKARGL